MSPQAVSNRWQVVVVGSGPVGLTLINLLGVLGIRALLVERNSTTVQEPRAVSIDDESLRTMQAAGVIGQVQEQIVPGYGSHYFTAGGTRFAKVEPSGTPYGYPRRNAFRQPVLEQQLRDALERFEHVETMYGWSLDRYAQEPDRVEIDIVDQHGDRRTMVADYLVGCDGASSKVRELQSVQLEGTTFDERWLIVDLENSHNMSKHTDVFCDRRRPSIALPGPNDTRRYEFKLHPGETDADLLDPGMVARLLRDHGADPDATIRRKVVYRFHARVAPRWSFGRVLLAGDAAHLTPPFAGQGMNSGIRDAHNLAWKLASVLRGATGQGMLDTYEIERKDHVEQMVKLALRIGKIMSPPSWIAATLTQVGFLALNLFPPARDYVAEMKYKPPPRFHAGFLLPDGKGRHSMVGRLVSQPLVRVMDGGSVLLDELLGIRFVLLLRTARPVDDFARIEHPVWDELEVRKVALLPPGSTPFPGAGFDVAAELDDAFGATLARYHGFALLLRPDHYVAAAIPLDSPQTRIREIKALLAGTWTRSALGPTASDVAMATAA